MAQSAKSLWGEYQTLENRFWENAQIWAKTKCPDAQVAYCEARERMKEIFAELDRRKFFK